MTAILRARRQCDLSPRIVSLKTVKTGSTGQRLVGRFAAFGLVRRETKPAVIQPGAIGLSVDNDALAIDTHWRPNEPEGRRIV